LASNGAEAGGFVKSDPSLQNPDLQLHFAPLLLDNHFIRTIGHGHCLHVCNLQPKSRGSVTLKSAKPEDPLQTDEEIKTFIRKKAETIYHPVGTCKMGTDELSVVDDHLRVHGTENLRIVDASVMPKINSGNTHATVIAIADKASVLISSEYR